MTPPRGALAWRGWLANDSLNLQTRHGTPSCPIERPTAEGRKPEPAGAGGADSLVILLLLFNLPAF
eukprot:10196265-Alexandrium_andersonii.AAC.1